MLRDSNKKVNEYSGIMTVDLDIPLKADGSTPDFNNPRLVFKSYKKDVKKVRLEDLGRHSQNLLDKEPISTQSFFGEDAKKNGFPYPSLRALLFKDEEGNYLSQLQRNKKYYITPLVGLPVLSEENGYEDYIGYAFKWEIIIHNNVVREDSEDAIRTIPWVYAVDGDGTIPKVTEAFLQLTGTEEELIKQWDTIGVNKRTQLPESFPDFESMKIGDIHRIPKTGTNLITVLESTGWKDFDGVHSYPIDSNTIWKTIPETYKARNGIPINNSLDTIRITIPNNESFETWEERELPAPSVGSKPFDTGYLDTNKIKSPIYSERNFVKSYKVMASEYNYYKFEGIEEGLFEINNRMKIFNNSTLGMQARLFIAPVKKKSGYTEEDLQQMDLDAQVITSAYMPYDSDEVLLPELNNTSTISDSRFITFFEDMVVLYGSTTHGNIIYLSDSNNVSYFPFKYALDQIPNEIIHIHPFQNVLVVFTKSDVWVIQKLETENEFGVITVDFLAKKVLQNIYIDIHMKNTIQTVGKYIMVFLQDKIIFLKPNSFTGDVSDLSFIEVSSQIGNILKDPSSYVKNRLRFYNIFEPKIRKFNLYSSVDNKDFKIILSTFIEEVNKPYMLEFRFNGNTGVWTMYDTLTTAYPVLNNSLGMYTRGHPEYSGGVVLSDVSGDFKYKVMNPDEAHMDIEQYRTVGDSLILNTVEEIKKTINAVINFGNLNITNHLNKRFHEVQFEMSNINSKTIDMAYEFQVDGRVQQTSDTITMLLDNYSFEEVRYMEFKTLDEFSTMNFSNFKLDFSTFPVAERLNTRIAANGRGRISSLKMSFNLTNDFELFRVLLIYKEQTSRKVI